LPSISHSRHVSVTLAVLNERQSSLTKNCFRLFQASVVKF
jgi:hypothetical protein